MASTASGRKWFGSQGCWFLTRISLSKHVMNLPLALHRRGSAGSRGPVTNAAVRHKRKDLNVAAQASAWLLVWQRVELYHSPKLARAHWRVAGVRSVRGPRVFLQLLRVRSHGWRARGPARSPSSPWDSVAKPEGEGRSCSAGLVPEPSEVSQGRT